MPDWMLFRAAFMAICVVAPLIASASATDFSPSATHMFRELHRQPNDLARYQYLLKMTPKLPLGDQQLGLQMFAAAESELGHYNEALRDFPLKSHIAPGDHLPTPADWTSADAVEVITRLAADRRLVMVNESHHDAHTRELTLALLPRLRALGFNYFAVEGLTEKDARLMQRGYPVETSGTEYLHEPIYGDIVRTAIRLGFKVISYDVDTLSQQARESGQASNLYAKTFARDPRAKVFVHAGYAHIDKAKGRSGNVQSITMYLRQLSGIEPLSKVKVVMAPLHARGSSPLPGSTSTAIAYEPCQLHHQQRTASPRGVRGFGNHAQTQPRGYLSGQRFRGTLSTSHPGVCPCRIARFPA